MIREFWAGVTTLVSGFGYWRSHPRLMALGLIPAVIAFALMVALLVPFAFALDSISAWMTPFADEWGEGVRTALRVGLGIVLFLTALLLAAVTFTALTLTIGDPFYQRIWRGVERSLGDEPQGSDAGFWTTLGEGIRLLVWGVLIAVLTLAIGLVPVIGGVIASVTGVVLSGRLLARELTGRSFDARGYSSRERARLLGYGRARVLGFGVATQLCFLIPLGAIVAMPAAVAGSALLSRELTARAATASPATPAPPR